MFSSIEMTNSMLVSIAAMLFWIAVRVGIVVRTLEEMTNDLHRTTVNVGGIQVDVAEACRRRMWNR